MIFCAQAVGHNDGVTVRQCATEVSQIQNDAQALDPSFLAVGWAGKSLLFPWRQGNPDAAVPSRCGTVAGRGL